MGPFHLFERFGVELEYMLVDACSLNILPEADAIFANETGDITSDVERGSISWSNELVKHVIELKTTDPFLGLHGLAQQFQEEVNYINSLAIHKLEAKLLPTGMHPWMNPLRETFIWPHENTAIYQSYNRIFNCKGHGWSNLQSCHINLPFYDDEEFHRLHAAIRILLPVMSALTASTPVCDATYYGNQDQRLDVYRTNQSKIPALTGDVIPESVSSQQQYEEQILNKCYAAVSPYDPEGIMQKEFLNSRGAIARFGRGSIEIRTLDLQECPLADLAVVQLISAVLKEITAERWAGLSSLDIFPQHKLVELFLNIIKTGGDTLIRDHDYLSLFGMNNSSEVSASQFWKTLLEQSSDSTIFEATSFPALDIILNKGTLAKRILNKLGSPQKSQKIDQILLKEIYVELAESLNNGKLWTPS